MIPPATARTLLRLTDIAAALVLAAIGAALVMDAPYAAVPHALRPGAWSQRGG